MSKEDLFLIHQFPRPTQDSSFSLFSERSFVPLGEHRLHLFLQIHSPACHALSFCIHPVVRQRHSCPAPTLGTKTKTFTNNPTKDPTGKLDSFPGYLHDCADAGQSAPEPRGPRSTDLTLAIGQLVRRLRAEVNPGELTLSQASALGTARQDRVVDHGRSRALGIGKAAVDGRHPGQSGAGRPRPAPAGPGGRRRQVLFGLTPAGVEARRKRGAGQARLVAGRHRQARSRRAADPRRRRRPDQTPGRLLAIPSKGTPHGRDDARPEHRPDRHRPAEGHSQPSHRPSDRTMSSRGARDLIDALPPARTAGRPRQRRRASRQGRTEQGARRRPLRGRLDRPAAGTGQRGRRHRRHQAGRGALSPALTWRIS